jgi:GNAT superfamily N-acetyltransferase
MTMTNSIQVRVARAEDKDAVLAFCQNTFRWGDYIPHVWDAWLADPTGVLLVATARQQPVAILRAAFLGNGIAWLEGMRVHPAFRRQGIATEMDVHARTVARQRGCRVARLGTSIKNLPAQKTLAGEGYQRVAQFNEWEAEPARVDFASARVATPGDAPAILARWHDSEIRAASHAVAMTRRWRWTAIDAARLHEQIAAGEARVTPRGFMLLLAFDEVDWSALNIHALDGDAETLLTLALAARGEAEYRGYPHVEATLADHAPLNDALARAGYRRAGGMFIYEQEL